MLRSKFSRSLYLGFCACFVMSAFLVYASSEPGVPPHPDWFKDSFLDLRDDLSELNARQKSGLVLFFHTPNCSYCKAFLNTTFADRKIVSRMQKHYDVIALDVLSDYEVIDFNGQSAWVKDFAVLQKAMFTPTVIFYDHSGKQMLRLVGYQSPEKFTAVLDYVEQGAYKKESLRAFLIRTIRPPLTQARAEKTSTQNVLPDASHNTQLLTQHAKGKKRQPLVVLFEKNNCDPCERLHKFILPSKRIQSLLSQFRMVRLNMNDNGQAIITPGHDKTTAKQWADALSLIHAPALIFFDEDGKEVMRLDSELLVDASGKALTATRAQYVDNFAARFQYVLSKGYLEYPQFQLWRIRQKQQGIL